MQQIKMRYEAPACAIERWNPAIKAAQKDDTAINIYSTIGEYGDGAGMTPRIVSAVLRQAKGQDVVVNINSPGGDFFDGLAIYSLLKEYDGNVKIRVLGMAASAASVVALAGDEIEIAENGFFMIHNSWTVAMGNKNDMKEVSARLSQFDDSMKNLYAAKTGMDEKKIAKMMDDETWIIGSEAKDMGFATAIMGSEDIEEDEMQEYANAAMKKMDVALAKAGMPRSERRQLIKEITSTPSAADNDTPSAVDEETKVAIATLINKIKG